MFYRCRRELTARYPGDKGLAADPAVVLAADFPIRRFSTVDALKLNRAGLTLYESRNYGLHRVWIDDVVVATTYIGPMITDQ